MQNKNELVLTGRNLEQLLKKAEAHFGVKESQLDYKINTSKKSGLFSSLFGKKIEVAVWVKSSKKGGKNPKNSRKRNPRAKREDRSKQDRPKQESRRSRTKSQPSEVAVLSASEIEELQSDLKKFCEDLCEFMVARKVKVETQLDEYRLCLNIDDDEIAAMMNKNYKVAESLEHLLRKKPRHLKRELPFRIFVDAQGYRLKREEDLIQLAKDLSRKVQQNKRPIVLTHKSSYDRKIIHMALDKDDLVYTKSIGSGANRKLMILPSKTKGEEVER